MSAFTSNARVEIVFRVFKYFAWPRENLQFPPHSARALFTTTAHHQSKKERERERVK